MEPSPRLRYLLAVAVASMAALVALVACGAATGRTSAGRLRHEGSRSRRAREPWRSCSRYASPEGSDADPGTRLRPYGSIARLLEALHPGQTGCLLPGVFREAVSFRRGGRRGRPITLTSALPTEATIDGRLWITNLANYVRVTHLKLDGANGQQLPSPTVDSIGDMFAYDDVTDDHTGICFELGSSEGWGEAFDTVLWRNRIHDCGQLPPTNTNHGVYVANSLGARIVQNYIYDNADRGVQLYWNAQRTLVAGNVIAHNGEGIMIGGDASTASSHNLILDNIIVDSTVRADIESWWQPGGPRGRDNVAMDNCVHGGRPDIDTSGGGFVARDNLRADPGEIVATASSYVLRPSRQCAALLTAAGPAAARYARLWRAFGR